MAMIVVIQGAGSKQGTAGHLQTGDGQDVEFVAQPGAAPADGRLYARPDDPSDVTGKSWRDLLSEYNRHPGDNPNRLLPAWKLYRPKAYKLLKERWGPNRLYILSAGWGLVSASFLTPAYDITFSSSAVPFKRRKNHHEFEDYRMLPSDTTEPIVFLGGKSYVELFCNLTADAKGERTVFFVGREPAAPGCITREFEQRRLQYTNWHYKCADQLVEGRIQLGSR